MKFDIFKLGEIIQKQDVSEEVDFNSIYNQYLNYDDKMTKKKFLKNLNKKLNIYSYHQYADDKYQQFLYINENPTQKTLWDKFKHFMFVRKYFKSYEYLVNKLMYEDEIIKDNFALFMIIRHKILDMLEDSVEDYADSVNEYTNTLKSYNNSLSDILETNTEYMKNTTDINNYSMDETVKDFNSHKYNTSKAGGSFNNNHE